MACNDWLNYSVLIAVELTKTRRGVETRRTRKQNSVRDLVTVEDNFILKPKFH